MRKTLLALLAAAPLLSLPVALPTPVQAATAVATADQPALLAKAETYLNGITSLKSDFIQTADNGQSARGTFTLLRPGRMRISYAPPVENFIVADGKFVYFWDAEVKEQQNAPIGSTLADFLLRDKITLSGDVKITQVARDDGLLEITLVQAKDPGLGSLTLVFEETPFGLRKWRVLDAQGKLTEVALQNPEFGVKLDANQFYFRNPTRGRERD
ncbi:MULTISPECIES: outer membrane lipoprotein carrier protein LolA [unclassified Azospirillum]|uniref:LolA family protein n=1 Tax=unclassified Azospirillum TaxID=2630922 RepID=UPI000B6AD24D|nr:MULTISPECIES: outer membrane lipoprotein carrier protein LolA [unclassified Azospirillum]SNT13703.1 Outer membrane lipoprotein-sorting protein [Azospirillum sp. RU38E]SNT27121.1 Outer membrane lipoprotein-sorting protein [Azospirillum sp. RU37A]